IGLAAAKRRSGAGAYRQAAEPRGEDHRPDPVAPIVTVSLDSIRPSVTAVRAQVFRTRTSIRSSSSAHGGGRISPPPARFTDGRERATRRRERKLDAGPPAGERR